MRPVLNNTNPPDDRIVEFRKPARPPETQRPREPVFNLPPVVAAIMGVCVVLHLLQELLPLQEVYRLIISLGFVPARYTGEIPLQWEALLAPFTYMWLHGDWVHLAINMVTLAAFGAGVERALGPSRFLAFFVVCGLLALAGHILIEFGSTSPVVGASGAISGLFGGVLIILQRAQARMGGGQQIQIYKLALIWIGVMVFFGLIGTPGSSMQPVAWMAHVSGFVAGFALYRFFEPPRDEPLPPRDQSIL